MTEMVLDLPSVDCLQRRIGGTARTLLFSINSTIRELNDLEV